MGCGKTGLMALLPFEIAQGRVLVIAPNLEIRRGISTALDVTGRECFWTSTRLLTDMSHGPFTGRPERSGRNIHDCESSHIVVTNIQQLASRADRWLPAFADNFFDLRGVAVSHVGLNIDRHWEDFRRIDQEDQELIQGWLEADGETRGKIPLERLEEVLDQIDQIGDEVQAQIQERLSRR